MPSAVIITPFKYLPRVAIEYHQYAIRSFELDLMSDSDDICDPSDGVFFMMTVQCDRWEMFSEHYFAKRIIFTELDDLDELAWYLSNRCVNLVELKDAVRSEIASVNPEH